ncbi:hypothetical protein JAO73_13070 [Hymenobacter sp. BT523]|uniref:hypothetical protein n=1 Tax=Hymenobacter sp. BT523 TaxID=2795725 RepID=UPI0018ED65C8|nr:hypothetical protein [Hymenobacter sp. BT523]MBJ6109947.1 hypothetical protein [Hymenobacter sp. BT523]
MRFSLFSAVYFLLPITSCQKSTPTPDLNGTYTGTFQRQSGGGGQVSQVSLTFSGGKWSGNSQIPKHPGLCSGTYDVIGKRITFTNICYWTADFDWSLILSDEYDLNVSGNVVEITKQAPSYKDVYRLSK